MTEAELEQLRRHVYDYAVMCQINWEKAQDELEGLVNFVNAMLAKREGE